MIRITFLFGITILLRKVKLELPVVAQLKRALWELEGVYDMIRGGL